MALKTFTPAADLPESAKNAIELAQNRVTALEGEQNRIQGAISELKTELISLEHSITESEAKLKELNDKSLAIESEIALNNDAADQQGERIALLIEEKERLQSECRKIEEEKAAAIATLSEVTDKKEQLATFIESEEEKIAFKLKLVSEAIELLEDITKKLK